MATGSSTQFGRERGAVPQEARPPIKPRRMRFAFDELQTTFFYDNNSLITSFIAALSAMFPPGEEEFVASVRNYLDQIEDPALLKQVRAFVAQEAQHADQHRRANRFIDELGLQATRIEGMLRDFIAAEVRLATPAQRLASTVGMEHITAVMAHHMLTNPETLDPLPPAARQLLKWHAVEEIEHKAVAFDVYEQCVGDKQLLNIVFLYSAFDFVYHTMKYQALLLIWAKKVPTPRDMLRAVRFFFGRKGLVTQTIRPFLQFLRRDFHPWDIDDSALVKAWLASQKEERHLEAA